MEKFLPLVVRCRQKEEYLLQPCTETEAKQSIMEDNAAMLQHPAN